MSPTQEMIPPEISPDGPQSENLRRNFFAVARREELFSSYSHLFGAAATLLGMLFLLTRTLPAPGPAAVVTIYGLSTTFLFISSFIYHSRKTEEDGTSVRRKLDHIAIFVMISGTFTPLCYLYLEGVWLWGILGAQWLLVVFGIIFKLLILNTPRWVTTGIYLLQGWMAVLPIGIFARTMHPLQVTLLFSGGILYSVGALFYNRKKPNPWPGVFGFHEIFHVFILLAAACHYVAILMGFW